MVDNLLDFISRQRSERWTKRTDNPDRRKTFDEDCRKLIGNAFLPAIQEMPIAPGESMGKDCIHQVWCINLFDFVVSLPASHPDIRHPIRGHQPGGIVDRPEFRVVLHLHDTMSSGEDNVVASSRDDPRFDDGNGVRKRDGVNADAPDFKGRRLTVRSPVHCVKPFLETVTITVGFTGGKSGTLRAAGVVHISVFLPEMERSSSQLWLRFTIRVWVRPAWLRATGPSQAGRTRRHKRLTETAVRLFQNAIRKGPRTSAPASLYRLWQENASRRACSTQPPISRGWDSLTRDLLCPTVPRGQVARFLLSWVWCGGCHPTESARPAKECDRVSGQRRESGSGSRERHWPKRMALVWAVLLAAGCQGSGRITGADAAALHATIVALLKVVPGQVSMAVGDSETVYAATWDANGNPLDRPITWASSDSTVATVASEGTIRGLSQGTANITATSEGVGGASHVTVGPVQPLGIPGQWNLVFDDEFDGDSLNTANWSRQLDWSPTAINGQLQYYNPAPDGAVTVKNGSLRLTATAQPQGGFPYTSGAVASQGKVTFLYGVIEARLRVPDGSGLWPAFWLMPADLSWPPEIDVAEFNGGEPARVYLAAHWGSSGDLHHFSNVFDGPNLTTAFHTYSLRWEPGALFWYVDGVRRAEWQGGDSVPAEPMYVIFNLAVGGSFVGQPSANDFPATLEIDYVRIWHPSGS